MTVRYYSSTARETQLTSTITSGSTTIMVGAVTGFPATTPYTLSLDYNTDFEELVQVTAAAGLSLTVVRAIDGTSAGAHSAGAVVRHVSSARDFADSRSHENAFEGVHGLGAGVDVVGDTSTQTLTNKTLASPAFSGSFTGTLQGSAAASSKFRLLNATDVSPTSTDHAFQVGPDSAMNIRADGNEIMAVNNGVVSTMSAQPDGGSLNINTNLAVDNIAQSMLVRGLIDSNLLSASRAVATDTGMQSKANADANYRWSMAVNGKQQWGPGTGATDVSLERTNAGQLTVTGSLVVSNTLNAANATIPTFNSSVNVVGSMTANNIRCGSAQTPAPGGGGGTTTVNVTFTPSMSGAPEVVVQARTAANPASDNIQWYIDNVTSSGFTIRCFRSANSVTTFGWHAIIPTQ